VPTEEPPGTLVDPAGAERRRDEVLTRLREAGRPLAADEVARLAGLHPNTARFHLSALLADGLVERATEARTSPGRPRVLYRARGDAAPGPRSYRLLAEMLTGLVGSLAAATGSAVEAGRAWGRRLVGVPAGEVPVEEAVARMNQLLDSIGFRPALHGDPAGEGEAEVWLHHCPFREVAEGNPDVVCALHLGLMQGALAGLEAAVTASSLEPFVRPDLCVARLSPVERRPA
jgi:predicted ArsR family transcriptional regulator